MKQLRALIEKNKKVFIALAAIAVLYSIWNTFFRGAGDTAFTSESSIDAASFEQGREIVATLARLNTVNIDPSVLSTNLFINLQDFSRELPQDLPAGKVNPFSFETVSSNPLTTSDITASVESNEQLDILNQLQQPAANTSTEDTRPGSENDAPAADISTQ